MAANYSILSQQRVDQYEPGGRVVSKYEVWAIAQPSGVAFVFRVTPLDYGTTVVGTVAQQLAHYINLMAAQPGVVSIEFEQGVVGDNSVDTTMLVTVESDTGNSTDVVRMPYALLQHDPPWTRLTAAIATLNAVEGL
jgi:hypothetical protein